MTTSLLSMLGVALGLAAAVSSGGPGGGGVGQSAVQPPAAVAASRDDTAAESLGWHLGAQSWTFRDRTAFEAIDTCARLGLKFIELYPGQPLSPEERSAWVGPSLSEQQVGALRAKLAGAGVTALSYGVVTLKNDEADARKHFAFVRAMGMHTLVGEPTPEARDMVARLADEHQVALAIHNHPKPSMYWNPDAVLEAIKGRGTGWGACADTGHWPRSGLRPLDCLKKLDGHVLELHFKDISKGLDVVWGTGESDARAQLGELKRQGFRGPIYVEYESGFGPELDANVARCIEFFDRAAREVLAESPKAGTPGAAKR